MTKTSRIGSNTSVSGGRARCGQLFQILSDSGNLPPSLGDLKTGFHFEWTQDFPHHNVVSAGGNRATVIYMGEESGAAQIEQVSRTAAENLHKTSADAGESLRTRQRLAVWYRKDDSIVLNEPYRYVKIDQTGNMSEFDIGRES